MSWCVDLGVSGLGEQSGGISQCGVTHCQVDAGGEGGLDHQGDVDLVAAAIHGEHFEALGVVIAQDPAKPGLLVIDADTVGVVGTLNGASTLCARIPSLVDSMGTSFRTRQLNPQLSL